MNCFACVFVTAMGVGNWLHPTEGNGLSVPVEGRGIDTFRAFGLCIWDDRHGKTGSGLLRSGCV